MVLFFFGGGPGVRCEYYAIFIAREDKHTHKQHETAKQILRKSTTPLSIVILPVIYTNTISYRRVLGWHAPLCFLFCIVEYYRSTQQFSSMIS